MAPIAGLYDPDSGQAGAIDVALFILIIGGFLGIVTKTGAIDAGIERVTTRLRGREEWMIPILMALFAAGGTIYGMAEESLPFYTLLVPVISQRAITANGLPTSDCRKELFFPRGDPPRLTGAWF